MLIARTLDSLIACLRRLLLWITLANYASSSFEHSVREHGPDRSKWSSDFRHLLASAHPTSNRITTLLSVLSSSMRNAAPLPPHLELPEPFAFAQKLEHLDPGILSVRHLNEPEYAAFAVMTVVSREVVVDLGECVR